jgi:hypothetical protein
VVIRQCAAQSQPSAINGKRLITILQANSADATLRHITNSCEDDLGLKSLEQAEEYYTEYFKIIS